jgi:hypothetical protein
MPGSRDWSRTMSFSGNVYYRHIATWRLIRRAGRVAVHVEELKQAASCKDFMILMKNLH